MIEYRLQTLPDALRLLLEEAEAFIGEEEFKGQKTYLIYSSDDISDILNQLGISFESKIQKKQAGRKNGKNIFRKIISPVIFILFLKKVKHLKITDALYILIHHLHLEQGLILQQKLQPDF